ncbi:hypothetical protein [Pararhodonellum marinum]|uniref:hypothetical protein n=1 Tax=Pararhodonellum marinum TaxID=2755358 RepID=UPI001890B308|nr:hypothetical protein [Pararhodonellum marinum]
MAVLIHIRFLLAFCFFFFLNEHSKSYIPQKEEEATLVIYRKSSIIFTTGFELELNEIPVLKEIRSNNYYEIKVNPGKVWLTTQGSVLKNLTDKKEYSLTLEAGKTYYLEALQEYQMMMTTLHLVRRQEGTAKQAIKKMKGSTIYVTVSDIDENYF